MRYIFKGIKRNIVRTKFFSLLNVLGLVLGITSALLLFAYVQNEFRFDTYHAQHQDIVRISCSTVIDDKRTEFAPIPPAFGPAIKESIPEIAHIARVSLPYTLNNGTSQLRWEDNEFADNKIFMADSSIFNILSFDFIEGNPSALQEPNTIVLSESLASKVFGPDFRNKTDLIGTIVEIDNVDFNVSGIIQDVPYNSHLIPSALISWTGLGPDDIWDDSQAYTYARLGANVNHEDLDKKLQKFADQNEHIIEAAERFGAKVQIYSQGIADIHLRSHKQYEVSINANWTNIYIYILMGVFFILACSTNYLNLSLALSINRFKEVGIRKILGSTNQQLRTQLFAESFFVIVSSFALSLLLFYLLLPSFGTLLNYKLSADILLDTRFILTALAIMTVVVAVSGIVPALSLSRLNPIQIVKAKYSQSRDRFPLRTVLIVFQFILATSMLTTILAMSRQVDFLVNKDLGFDNKGVLIITLPESPESAENLHTLKTLLEEIPAVSSVASTDYKPGSSMIDEHFIERGNGEMRSSTVARIFGDANLPDLLGFKIIAGRNFDINNQADYQNAFLVNEAAVKQYNWERSGGALGKRIDGFNYNKKGTVIGVIQNANLFSLRENVNPVIISLSDFGYFLYVKVFEPNIDVIEQVKAAYAQSFDGYPFQYEFMTETYGHLYDEELQANSVMQTGTYIIMVISCLGLFGLSILQMSQYFKEVAVRKVLGAQNHEIYFHFAKQFIKMIVIANLFSIPLTYMHLSDLLSSYAYQIPLTFWLFVIPLICTVVIALGTVTFTILKVSRTSPVAALKRD